MAVLISFNWSYFNKCSSNSATVPWKVVLFELKISYTAFISLCHSPSKILHCRRRWEWVSLTLQWSHSGVISRSILLLWLFSMQCPDFSLIIFEAPFLEVCLRCNAHCLSSSLETVGTMFSYLLSFVLFHLLCHLLRAIFLFSVFISDDIPYGLGSVRIWLTWCHGWYLWGFAWSLWLLCHGSFSDFGL